MTTLIKNGTVVSTTGRHEADVLIDGEKIAAILQPGTSAAVSAGATESQDTECTGCMVGLRVAGDLGNWVIIQ